MGPMIKLSNAFIVGETQEELGTLQALLVNYSPNLNFEITDNNEPEAGTFLYKLLVSMNNIENESSTSMSGFLDFLQSKIDEVNQG